MHTYRYIVWCALTRIHVILIILLCTHRRARTFGSSLNGQTLSPHARVLPLLQTRQDAIWFINSLMTFFTSRSISTIQSSLQWVKDFYLFSSLEIWDYQRVETLILQILRSLVKG